MRVVAGRRRLGSPRARARGRGTDSDLRRMAWRIGWQTGLLLIGCLLVVGVVAYTAVVRSQEQQLTQSLTDAAEAAALTDDPGRDHDRDRDLSEPRGGIQTALLDQRGLRMTSDMPPGLPDVELMRRVGTDRQTDQRTVHLDTGAYEVLTTVNGGDVVQAVASRFEQHQERERIVAALALAGGLGLVLATLAAAVLARRAVRPMAEALELQRRFVADAGHELRTPLTLLSTRAQLLARRTTGRATSAPEDRDRLIARDAEGIVADTAALTAVLEELLLAADVRTPVPQEPVDVSGLVTAVVASAQAEAERNGVTLSVAGDPGAVMAAGAPVALSRAVRALVDNALRHARREVVVSLTCAARTVRIEVADDGPGIAEEVLPRVFTRFAGAETAHAGPGERRRFGLGLALVSEIATRHGGSVTAANRPAPASGALLSLILPR